MTIGSPSFGRLHLPARAGTSLGLPSSLMFLFTHATLLPDPGRPSATSPLTVAPFWLLEH